MTSDPNKLSVLIVDDDRLDGNALARALRAALEGWDDRVTVRVCVDPRSALDEITADLPDVVVVEQHLSPVASVRLLARVAAQHPSVRRLLVTRWPIVDRGRVPPDLAEAVLDRADVAGLAAALRGPESNKAAAFCRIPKSPKGRLF